MKTLAVFFLLNIGVAFGDLTLTWTANPASQNVVKYCLYEIKAGAPFKIAETTGLDNKVIDALVGNHTYAVSAINSAGIEGPLSCPVDVALTAGTGVSPSPAKPVSLSIQ